MWQYVMHLVNKYVVNLDLKENRKFLHMEILNGCVQLLQCIANRHKINYNDIKNNKGAIYYAGNYRGRPQVNQGAKS